MENEINQNQPEVNEPEVVKTSNSNKSIVSAIIIAGILIAGAILLKEGKPRDIVNNNSTSQIQKEEIKIKPITDEDHILGNKDAKIKIVEYSDTGCPFCKIFHTTMHQLVNENDGEVAWVYRHFPILSLHPNSFTESLGAECAYEQGGDSMFWDFIDQIYTRTKANNTFTTGDLTKIAEDLNLTIYAFNECVDNKTHTEKVEQNIIDGQLASVQGTPTSFIVMNGKVVDTIQGAAPYASIQARLEQLLLE